MAQTDKHTLIKKEGQIFTPDYLVDNILNFAGYADQDILKKHIIDNSCGTGAFLSKIVDRYCSAALKCGYSIPQLKSELETFIHGIEIEQQAFKSLTPNLNAVAAQYGINGVKWDIYNSDALTITKFNHQMDFVVGNPPYVRVHNLNDNYNSVKSFSFADGGMTDLYLVFYELGLRMLTSNGILCYITPSSWLSSLAGNNLRNYIRNNKTLVGLIDLAHFQPFNATSYTLIALFKNGVKTNHISYYKYDATILDKSFVCNLSISDMDILGNFFLSTPNILSEVRKIKTYSTTKYASVKNGFATLADKIFIGNVPEVSITIPIIKASTGKWYRGLFPYNKNGNPIPTTLLFSNPDIKNYFETHKASLTKGKSDIKDWMYYGRSQALKDVNKNKYSINCIIKDKNSIKLNFVPAGCGVYSGLYILTDAPEYLLRDILISDDFIKYVKSLKNYKSGGYYTFKSKDLEQYINYRLNHYEHIQNHISANKSRVPKSYIELV